MGDYNFSMVRGDTVAFGLELEDLDQDLDTAFFTVRQSYDGPIVFQRSIGNGIEKAETGVYRIRIAPENTAGIEAGKYYYDLQIGVNSDIFTPMIGVMTVEHDVTYQ